jgi:hypothetical protein
MLLSVWSGSLRPRSRRLSTDFSRWCSRRNARIGPPSGPKGAQRAKRRDTGSPEEVSFLLVLVVREVRQREPFDVIRLGADLA